MQADTKRSSANLIRGWEIVIGLEVHAQVASKASCSRAPRPRSAASPTAMSRLVDAAMPGMLPVINDDCVARRCGPGSA